MKYIDAEKLKAEIERRLVRYDPAYTSAGKELNGLLSFVASLQQEQPEVDLEKEYETWWNSISGKINIEHMMEWYIHETARRFYELGLNARKEK